MSKSLGRLLCGLFLASWALTGALCDYEIGNIIAPEEQTTQGH